MRIDIKSRFTCAALFSFEAEINSVKITLEAAVKAGANLTDADLTDADLTDADLAGANLARADLTDANLARANLAGADLAGADLAGAYLARADLTDADLTDANLTDANLAGADLARADLTDVDLTDADLADADLAGAYLARADLTDADLTDADLAGADLAGANLARANLAGADLAGADLAGAKNLPQATDEEIARLDQVRAIVLAKPERLDMSIWHGSKWDYTHTPEEEHSCDTPHCISGWLQALSPDEQVRQMEPREAGTALAPASSYMFTQSNAVALAWLKDRAYAAHKEAAKA